MELTTVFHLIFVVGIAAIPVLYWLFVRNGDREQSEEGRAERESRSEEHGPNRGEGSTTETPEPS